MVKRNCKHCGEVLAPHKQKYCSDLCARTFRKEHPKKPKRNYREILIDVIGKYCVVCLKEYKYSELEVDHIIPISVGGENKITNIQALCRPCHKNKTSKDRKLW